MEQVATRTLGAWLRHIGLGRSKAKDEKYFGPLLRRLGLSPGVRQRGLARRLQELPDGELRAWIEAGVQIAGRGQLVPPRQALKILYELRGGLIAADRFDGPAPDFAERFDRAMPATSSLNLREADVQGVFVEPLLQALGWDVHDSRDVERQRAGRSGILDYMVKHCGAPEFVIECKKQKAPLGNVVARQACRYARAARCEFFVITNARRLKTYALRSGSSLDLFEVDFADGRPDERGIRYLSLLSKEAFTHTRLRRATHEAIGDVL